MEENTIEDWLKLLLYTTCQDKELLSKVLAQAWTLETAQNVIDYVEAEECGRVNTERLLGGKAIAAVVRGQNGDAGDRVPKCHICQKQGHYKQECTVDKSKLYCQHCKKKTHHTNKFCPVFKRKNKDKTKEGNNKPGDKKKAKARAVKETGKEEDEDEDSDTTPLFVSRLQWWPLEETDSEGELDTSNEPEVLFLDSEFETEDNSSENESGYFTPPTSPV